MTFHQFLNILNKRKISIIIIFILTVSASVAVTKIIPKSYKATASVLLNLRGVDLVTDKSVRIPTNTHIGILKSRRVAFRVVKILGLSSQQNYISSFLKANKDGGMDINSYIAEEIGHKLSISAGRKLGVISISYESTSPSLAKVMANAYVEAYIETIIEMNNDLPKRTAFWFSKEVDQYHNNYEEALKELDTYQKESGIYDTGEFDYDKDFLIQLNTRLFDAQKKLTELELKISSVNKDLSNFSDIVDDDGVEAIRLNLMKARTAFYEKASTLDKNHPDYKKLFRKVETIKNFLRNETKTAYEKILRKRDSLVTTIESIKYAIQWQKDKINLLNGRYEKLKKLQVNVSELNDIYTQAKQRLSNLKLQTKSNASESEVSILTKAIEPSGYFKPKLSKIFILGLFFGFVLAISYAMLRELVKRRVRIEDDITVSVGLPVVGQLKDGAKR